MYSVEVKSKLSPSQRADIADLIYDVWSFEQKENQDVEVLAQRSQTITDPLDDHAVHVLVHDEKQLVGYGRLTLFLSRDEIRNAPEEVPTVPPSVQKSAFISRLVVHPRARGRGIATMIDEVRISIAKSYGASTVVGCAVGEVRQRSLAHAGFETLDLLPTFKNPWYKTKRPVRVMRLNVSDLGSIRSA